MTSAARHEEEAAEVSQAPRSSHGSVTRTTPRVTERDVAVQQGSKGTWGRREGQEGNRTGPRLLRRLHSGSQVPALRDAACL